MISNSYPELYNGRKLLSLDKLMNNIKDQTWPKPYSLKNLIYRLYMYFDFHQAKSNTLFTYEKGP